MLPTCAPYFELTDAFAKDEAFRLVDGCMAGYSVNAAKAIRRFVGLPGGRGFFMRVFGRVLGIAFGEKQGYKNDMREGTTKRIAYDVLACPCHRVLAEWGRLGSASSSGPLS